MKTNELYLYNKLDKI